MKIQHTQTYGIQLKQFLEGNLYLFIFLSYKEESSQINNLIFYLKALGWGGKLNLKKRQETIKFRVEITEIENRKTREKIADTETQFFGKINKINKSLAILIILKDRRLQLLESEMKEGHYYQPFRNKNN